LKIRGVFVEYSLYTIRPNLRQFIFWVLLAPILLLEGKVSRNFIDTIALNNPEKRSEVTAQITATREPKAGEIYIQYRFQIPGSTAWYSRSDDLFEKRTGLVVPIKLSVWKTVRDEMELQVYYLPEDPWVNKPVQRAGNPVGDSFAGWMLFLAFDLYWGYETIQIIKEYRLSRLAMENRQEERRRFWRTEAF